MTTKVSASCQKIGRNIVQILDPSFKKTTQKYKDHVLSIIIITKKRRMLAIMAVIIEKFMSNIKRINKVLILLITLTVLVFVIMNKRKRYDYEIVKVRTLIDEKYETGDPCLIIDYRILNATDETIVIREIYNECVPKADILDCEKNRLLKYPALIIDKDTVFGRHTWKINAIDKDSIVIKNNAYYDRIIVSPNDILRLYKLKYSQNYSLRDFMKYVSLNAKLLYEYETFDKTFHVGFSELGKDIVFSEYDSFGDENLYLDY